MARQKGAIKIQGTIGDLSFVKTQDGYLVKEKSEISKSRIETDANFQRTRENNREFKDAAGAIKLIRTQVSQHLKIKDRRLFGRMLRIALPIVQSDAVHDRGERRFADGTISLLEGFEMNGGASFQNSANLQPSPSIDRVSGELELTLPSIASADVLNFPQGATHYRFILIGTAFNFNEKTCVSAMEASEYQKIEKTAAPELSLACNLPAATQDPIFLFGGIQFAQIVNNKHYPLKDGTHTALCILRIDA